MSHPAQLDSGAYLMKGDVTERLVQMNNHFGRGNVAKVDFTGAGDHGECHFPCIGVVSRNVPISQTETRCFRIDETGTLHYAGHQSKLGKPMKL